MTPAGGGADGSVSLSDRSAHELTELLRRGEVTAAEVTESALARVGAVDGEISAFLRVTADEAREAAAALDAAAAGGEPWGPVAGIPLALKDIFTTKGIRTTAGSRILEPYVPPYDATPWVRLREGGAILIGKTNCDEFAMGSSNENSAYGPVHNPWDLSLVPGGSSGGSAAAVAAGESVWALGTDTGGSVRQPAALCGVVGMKPTYGRVSRYGLIAFASSLDHVGTFTRDVRDAATLLGTIAGRDPMDATSLEDAVPNYGDALGRDIKGLRVGVVESWLANDGTQPGVRDAVRRSIDLLAELGAHVEPVELPHSEYALSAYYLIAPAECSSNLARFDGVRYGLRVDPGGDVERMNRATRGAGFGDEVKRRIMLGTYALSAGYYDAFYGQAQKVRTLVIRDFDEAFGRFDVIVGPTSPTVAFPIGEKANDPLAMYLCDLFTIPADLSGMPAISVPCGLSEGLPVGFQIIGPLLGESIVFQVGAALEEAVGFDARASLVASATVENPS